MNKEVVKKIIIEHQLRIPGLEVMSRNISVEPDANYIFTGQRRAGKTYFIYSLIQQHLQKNIPSEKILYFNFEDERLIGMGVEHLDMLIEGYKELYNTTPLIFFDEIQIVAGWQKFARRLADSGYQCCITGSNSTMLSGEMASTLGGRFLIKEINTLSFEEFIRFKDILLEENYAYTNQRFDIIALFNEYFYMGGFPETLNFADKKEYLSGLFQKVFLGDIVSRYNIRNVHAMKLLLKKMAESITDETSYNRIKNIINSTGVSVGTATLIEYLNYLEEAFMIKSVNNFYSKITERETKKKYYFRDNGLLNLFLIDGEPQLLENLVFNKLYMQYCKEVFYAKDNTEVDFYVPGKILLQVCYRLGNAETRKREVGAIVKVSNMLKAEKYMIITSEEEEIIELGNLRIEVLPCWKWLLIK